MSTPRPQIPGLPPPVRLTTSGDPWWRAGACAGRVPCCPASSMPILSSWIPAAPHPSGAGRLARTSKTSNRTPVPGSRSGRRARERGRRRPPEPMPPRRSGGLPSYSRTGNPVNTPAPQQRPLCQQCPLRTASPANGQPFRPDLDLAEGPDRCPACYRLLTVCLRSPLYACQSVRRMPDAEMARYRRAIQAAAPDAPIWDQLRRRILVLRGYQRRAGKRLRQRTSRAARQGVT
jgi:hypothetical protein